MSSISCAKCPKSFQSVSSRNRHLREIHKDNYSTKKSRIMCPLCSISVCSFNLLTTHLTSNHDIQCESTEMAFSTKTDFDTWKEQTERETKSFYALTTSSESNLGKILYYVCHRSNLSRFQSSCKVRAPKAGGSIKMDGVCPSRIRAEIHSGNGKISVTFSSTHVGHDKELMRCQPLSDTEKNSIIKQIQSGVSYETILENARLVESDDCGRLSLLTRKDLHYIAKRNTLEGKRIQNDCVAVDMKVTEWNEGGRENVFFYKKIGDCHDILKTDDFVLAYMNENMAKMLKTYGPRLICTDGTHGTYPCKFHLTTYFVLDDHDLGYPTIFLITNRQDARTHEVVISKLKDLIGLVRPSCFMTDDSLVHYNAWTTVMGETEHRLLCPWYVQQDWATQIKSKIQKQEVRKKVESDLDTLLKETHKEVFLRLKHCLVRYLRNNHEIFFLKYLNTHYFQNEERIASWAHSYRQDVTISASSESFHNTYFGGKTVQSLKCCLDTLDKLLTDKSWNPILRPTATRQDLVVNQEHEQATTKNFKNVAEAPDDASLVHSRSQTTIDEDACRALLESVLTACNSADDYNYVLRNLLGMKERLAKINSPPPMTSRKRDIETQTVFPNKKYKQ